MSHLGLCFFPEIYRLLELKGPLLSFFINLICNSCFSFVGFCWRRHLHYKQLRDVVSLQERLGEHMLLYIYFFQVIYSTTQQLLSSQFCPSALGVEVGLYLLLKLNMFRGCSNQLILTIRIRYLHHVQMTWDDGNRLALILDQLNLNHWS